MRGGCAEFVRTHALQEAGSFVISHIYTGVGINAVLQKSFFGNRTLKEKHWSPSLINHHHGDGRLCVDLVLVEVPLANPGSPSSRLRTSHQPLPPVPDPPPPPGSGERLRTRWLLRSKQHPEHSILPTPNHTATFLVLPPPSDPSSPSPV